MPSFGDMLEVVNLLQVKYLGGRSLNCVAVRNKNSKCRKCEEACIKDAISIGYNEVIVDFEKCVNCGCCVSVCPGNALSTTSPTEQETLARAKAVADRKSGMTVVACSRKASKREGNPDMFAEVPCLGHVPETLLLELVASGIDDIVLVDGVCETCVYGKASPLIDAAIEVAADMLEASDSQAIITRTSEFPPEVLEKANASLRGRDRRGILKQTGSYVKSVASNVAEKTINDRAGISSDARNLRLQLPPGKSGKFPKIEPMQNYTLLESMERASTNMEAAIAAGNVLESRHFGDVWIDSQECSGCGLCITACPTSALKYSELEDHSDESMRYVEFQASDCIQCNLCAVVCLRDAVTVSPVVSLESLYDFEPKLIEIKRPQNDNLLSDLKRRLNRR